MNRPTYTRRTFLGRAAGLAGATALVRPAAVRGARAASAEEFDYIIVGAGSTGCVLANRLTARPDVRVLLLEAGGPGDDPRIARPGRWASLLGGEFDWNYQTEPQERLAGRTLPWPRGKVLGGSSAINAMVYVRGHRLDFDHWNYLGNAGWGFEALLPLFKRSEANSRGASAFHGDDGPLAVSDTLDPTDVHHAFLEAARSLGFGARPDFDFNGPTQEDTAGFYQKNIRDGARHSAAAAFLVPVLTRPNLVVRTRCLATRLSWEGRRVTGLEYLRDGRIEQVRARRDVIVSGGVVESPKLLMLSGIGPPDELRRLGIDVVVDLPGVGANLEDHLKVSVLHRANREIPPSTTSAGLFTRAGPGLEASSPGLQFYYWRGVDTPSPTLAVTVALERPQSRGTVRLRSADPIAPPRIDPGYLGAAADVEALVAGVRIARDLARARAFDAWRGAEIEPGGEASSAAALAEFVRRVADTIYHPAGTCRMGSDSGAVVDARLRVHGVEGLRVADASIMPTVVNGNTNAACTMIGEKSAEMILQDG